MPALKKYHDREDGFTLIELLIVVLIIGILAAIAIPVYIGIQNQGYKSAVKADVNISVKRVQVALTEGKTTNEVKADQTSFTQRSVKGEVLSIGASPTAGAGASDFSLSGIVSTTSTPTAGPINYTYTYDSVTGKFSESDSGSNLPTVAITTASLPDGNTTDPYSKQINATVSNPTASTAYTATGLPTGLSLNSATGLLSGSTANQGDYPVTVTVTNGAVSDSKTYTLHIYAAPIFGGSAGLPAGIVGTDYSATLAASGNPAPTFTVTSGALPTGVSLSTAGVFAGKPSATGTFPFTVTATNAGGTKTSPYTITVNSTPAISTLSIANGVGNVAYSQTIAATGTPAPTFTATGLPSTLTIDPATGVISGTPTAGGTYNNVQVTATNQAGSKTQTYSMTVAAPPAAPTGAVIINRFTDEGGSRTSFHNYMWAGNAGSCAVGELQYNFVDGTGSNRGSAFWQNYSNFEIFNPYAVGTVNTWTVKTRCQNLSTGAISTEVVSPTRNFTSLPTSGNVLSNASFENGNMNSWGTGAGNFTSLSATSGYADGGTGSWMAQGTTGSSGASLEQDIGGTQNAGKSYYSSIWIRTTTPGAGANMCVWNITAGQNNCISYAVTSDWKQITVPYTLTSNSSQIRLEIYLSGNSTYQFDDAVLRPTN